MNGQSRINTLSIINRLLGVKGNIVRIKFRIENRIYETLVPDDQMWISIKDILLNREYEYESRFNLSNFRDAVVIDAGAHVGLYSLVASTYAKEVIAVEPHPVNYRLLQINKIINYVNNMITINAAIVGKDSNQIVQLCENTHSANASIMKISSRCYEVPAITLNKIVEEHVNGNDDLILKIDIEGAEFEVFKYMDLSLLKRFRAIVGEIHLHFGDLNIMIEKLKSAGFKVKYFHPPLLAKNAEPKIEVKNLLRLKALRLAIYTVASIFGLKETNLVIFFAYREN